MAQGQGQVSQQLGLFVTQLLGKRLAERARLAALERGGVGAATGLRPPHRDHTTAVYLYDEWDHVIGDYRRDWCRLREVAVAEDAGVFYEHTLARHAELVPEIRRHFQLVRPEAYRTVRGLEDGEDFDLGAVVDARAQLRARRTPSAKLYTKRVRQERDVATLFLVDLSASTDEAPGGTAGDGRIIDITREALVLMAAALEEIGDAFAIYGFSGQGRDNVEFFPVKSFDERLTPAVKGRIGGLAPRGSTRMGTALRHALTKLKSVTAPSRHLLLLSDGFPQDLDYGQDRQSHAYGIRDTATALRETQAAGVQPFCITVDAAGHDYLRDMCDPQAYLVIDQVADLPRELPKIYQRLVWAS
jgi:nitric oxide reductase activation protein